MVAAVAAQRRRRLALVSAAVLLDETEPKSKTRRFGVHPLNRQRDGMGDYATIFKPMTEHPDRFQAFYRLTPDEFTEVLALVGPALLKMGPKALSPSERLAFCLKVLAHGGDIASEAHRSRMGISTGHSIVEETCLALWEALQWHVKCPTTEDDWKVVADGYHKRWQFPGCLGSADGKHIHIKCPPNSGSMYWNYKSHFSVILMAVCDSGGKFLMVDVGAYGKSGDAAVWATSALGVELEKMDKSPLGQPVPARRRRERGEIGAQPGGAEGREEDVAPSLFSIPQPTDLPTTDSKFPFVFVGDEAFPLRRNIMVPFSGAKGGLPYDRRVFNYRLSRARRCIENAFGTLSQRWRILLGPIESTPGKVDGIVKACTALHNFLCDKHPAAPLGQPVPAPPPTDPPPPPPPPQDPPLTHPLSLSPAQLRLHLCNYFQTAGSVHWQHTSI
jgi:hypothetical protein